MLSIKELSEYVNLPYTTTVKYLKALQNRGFITSKRDGKRVMYPEDTRSILEQFVELIRNGTPFSQALEKFARGDIPLNDPVLEEIRKLRREVEDLKKENRALQELVQLYLARIDELKALPKPKNDWWKRMIKHLKDFFNIESKWYSFLHNKNEKI